VEQKPLGAFLLQLEKNIVGDCISQLNELKLVRHIHRDPVRFPWEWDSKHSPKNGYWSSCITRSIHSWFVFFQTVLKSSNKNPILDASFNVFLHSTPPGSQNS